MVALPPVDTSLEIRPYQRRDLTALRRLALYNYHMHTHLDWQSVEDYLRDDPPHLWVAYYDDQLRGALGLSEAVDGYMWLRIAGMADHSEPLQVLQTLWAHVRGELIADGARGVSVLMMRDWIEDWLTAANFNYTENIVTLQYDQSAAPDMPIRSMATLAPIETYHLAEAAQIDYMAFDSPWHMTTREVRMAVRAGSYNTVAVLDGRVVGYQVATLYGNSGHLARLAVHPNVQGRGIGGALVVDMLRWFNRRNIHHITVNTQHTNVRSLRLYERYHFRRTGFDVPVYTYHFDDIPDAQGE